MNGLDIATFGVLFILSILFGGIFYGIVNSQNNMDAAFSQANHDLEVQGYIIVKGSINSPTVIEITNDYYYFTSNVPENVRVYDASIGYTDSFIAIFNETYGLAYQPNYKIMNWWIW